MKESNGWVLSTEEEKKLERRRRRIRNQVISYISLIVLILLVVIGGFFAVKFISEQIEMKEQLKIEEAEFLASVLEAEEEEVVEVEEEEIEETEVVEYTKDELLDEIVYSCISEMSLEDKVAGLFFVTPEAITGVDTVIAAGDATQAALEEYPVGGLAYFAQNIQSEDQIIEMLANTVSMSKYPIFLGVDEEGGNVARLANSLNLDNVGTMAEIGETGDASAAYTAMETIGTYLLKYGFNVDFAPVADVLTNEDNTSIGTRSFSSDVDIVTSLIPSAVLGLQDLGISACLKHFPGQGDADGDTHDERASIDKTLEELMELEFLPFQAGIEAGVNMIMVSHLLAPEVIEDNDPSSLSEEMITDVLRGQLGYDGIVITDALNMSAITDYYGADEAAIKALKAGVDMLLMPEDFELAYQGVLDAVADGTISEDRIDDSLARIYRVKYADTISD